MEWRDYKSTFNQSVPGRVGVYVISTLPLLQSPSKNPLTNLRSTSLIKVGAGFGRWSTGLGPHSTDNIKKRLSNYQTCYPLGYWIHWIAQTKTVREQRPTQQSERRLGELLREAGARNLQHPVTGRATEWFDLSTMDSNLATVVERWARERENEVVRLYNMGRHMRVTRGRSLKDYQVQFASKPRKRDSRLRPFET